MTRLICEAFDRYGANISVEHAGETVQTKGFVQPLMKETKNEPFSMEVLGAVDERCWRYLGRACVAEGDTVTFLGVRYIVRRASAVPVGDEVAYYQAVLHIEEETA
ncbi:MAG: hypothetical protein Q3995_06955 [Eubacteriales bacterium]|nr:hypothetical protein [Eubacteriales bacterium]